MIEDIVLTFYPIGKVKPMKRCVQNVHGGPLQLRATSPLSAGGVHTQKP